MQHTRVSENTMINWRAYEKACVYVSSFEKISMLLLNAELFACINVHRPFPITIL